jgi:hypothetical protein
LYSTKKLHNKASRALVFRFVNCVGLTAKICFMLRERLLSTTSSAVSTAEVTEIERGQPNITNSQYEQSQHSTGTAEVNNHQFRPDSKPVNSSLHDHRFINLVLITHGGKTYTGLCLEARGDGILACVSVKREMDRSASGKVLMKELGCIRMPMDLAFRTQHYLFYS